MTNRSWFLEWARKEQPQSEDAEDIVKAVMADVRHALRARAEHEQRDRRHILRFNGGEFRCEVVDHSVELQYNIRIGGTHTVRIEKGESGKFTTARDGKHVLVALEDCLFEHLYAWAVGDSHKHTER